MKKNLLFLFLISYSFCVFSSEKTQLFSLRDVRLTPSVFYDAQQTDLHYILALDPDKLLAPFRREAGLPLLKESYGNWESSGLDGHMGGHYLSALALMYASTGNQQIQDRLNYMIEELRKCQEKNGNGYLGGIPDGKTAWAQIERGELKADSFSVNGKWVPWYNLHKLFAGLRDAYELAGNQHAKLMLIALSDWALNLTSHLSTEQMQQMLQSEQGGMNEVFVDVARITGDQKYLQLAQAFSHKAILEPLEKGEDKLTGLHANTQIPKVIGFEKIGDALQDDNYRNAAHFFWKTVIEHRTVAIGGNSVSEHFHDANNFSSMIENIEGPETCNTYNMLRLTELLYQTEPNQQNQTIYSDYYERALYNHILASQRPETGGFVYFTPMRPNHFRVYSEPEKAMWCCVGSGLESHAKYGEFIYAHQKNRLLVNLFIPSHLSWKEQGVELTQSNLFPDEAKTEFRFDKSVAIELAIRYPRWIKAGELSVRINGKIQTTDVAPGEYIILKRHWKKGDKVSLELPMDLHFEQMPDKSNYYAVLYGPLVLSAKTNPLVPQTNNYFADDSRMGHVPNGKICPLEAAPMFISDTTEFKNAFKPVAGKSLTFTAEGLIKNPTNEKLEFIPFFRLHDSRYMIYWGYATPKDYDSLKQTIAQKEAEYLSVMEKTIDHLTPGEQQPETDHKYKAEETSSGVTGDRHWRHTKKWMSYEFTDVKSQAKFLRVEYSGADGGRLFDIFVNDQLIAQVNLVKAESSEIYAVIYKLPQSVHKNSNGKLVVKFVAKPDSIAGGIYDLRLLK